MTDQPTARQIKAALDFIETDGFGADVDADSIIEKAARLYLAQILNEQERQRIAGNPGHSVTHEGRKDQP